MNTIASNQEVDMKNYRWQCPRKKVRGCDYCSYCKRLRKV